MNAPVKEKAKDRATFIYLTLASSTLFASIFTLHNIASVHSGNSEGFHFALQQIFYISAPVFLILSAYLVAPAFILRGRPSRSFSINPSSGINSSMPRLITASASSIDAMYHTPSILIIWAGRQLQRSTKEICALPAPLLKCTCSVFEQSRVFKAGYYNNPGLRNPASMPVTVMFDAVLSAFYTVICWTILEQQL